MWINKGKKVPLMGFQTGGYIPGLSGVQFRGGLQKDIRQTQEDIEEQSGDLAKHQKKTGLWGQVGGWLGEKGLQYAMTAASAGNPALAAIMKSPLGKAAVKGIGKGAGQLFGSKGAGKAPEITDSSTGLLGGQYDILRDVKQRSEDAIGGKALKAGANRFLTAGGGEYLEGKFDDVMKDMRLAQMAGEELPDAYDSSTDVGSAFDDIDIGGDVDIPDFNESFPELPAEISYTGGDMMTTPQDLFTGQEGGYVPGYENGGSIYGMNRTPEGMMQAIYEMPTEDGNRYYLGESHRPQPSLSTQTARQKAMQRAVKMPEDSISFEMVQQILNQQAPEPENKGIKMKKGLLNLLGFQNGGNVPMFNPMNSHGAIDQLMVDNLYEQMPQRMSYTSRGPRLMEVDPGVDYEMRRPAPVQDAELSDRDLMDLLHDYGANEFVRIFGRQDRRLGMLPQRHFRSPAGLAPKPLPRR